MQRLYNLVNRRFRQRRMEEFIRELRPTTASKILDVGGTPYNWSFVGEPLRVTLLNLRAPPPHERDRHPNLEFVEADARDLPFADGSFDIVFSNSLIEHLATWEDQQRFASEARRVGRSLWVQTPARSFPVEPHLMTPLVHFLPRAWQRRLIRNFTVWGIVTRPTRDDVVEFVREVRLLDAAEMKELFPDCTLRLERFAGMTKSYIAVRQAAGA